jgi:hypothetical protein
MWDAKFLSGYISSPIGLVEVFIVVFVRCSVYYCMLIFFPCPQRKNSEMRFFPAVVAILIGILSLLAGNAFAISPGSDIQVPQGSTLVATGPKGSSLYQLKTEGSVYEDAPYLINLTAKTSYEQGYDAGFLLGKMFVENYNNLMVSMLGNEWWEPAVTKLISVVLEWQWNDYLKKQVPQEYLDELLGMTAGGRAAGIEHDVGAIAGWGITLANMPGSLENLKYILIDEKNNPAGLELLEKLRSSGISDVRIMELYSKLLNNYSSFQCSMFGVWGSRTQLGKLYTGRNLDWLKDTGISKYKLVTVHHPLNGFSHATIGWAGIWGAITGMSSQGITVHEANLESNDITFRGFPWILRLRHVMAHSKNLADALDIWASTNNTVGFNHGFGSAHDREAVCLETMMGNSAVFRSNDPREQNLIVNGQNIGAPREEAVYRTNHGYDPYTVQHYMWNNTGAYKYSVSRYMLFPELLDNFKNGETKITYKEAVSIT